MRKQAARKAEASTHVERFYILAAKAVGKKPLPSAKALAAACKKMPDENIVFSKIGKRSPWISRIKARGPEIAER